MDVEGSDYSKSELDSLQMLEDELRLDHHPPSVPDVPNTTEQLSKRVAALELELERTRLELSAKNAANQGLKSIITELHVDARVSIQEKQQLHNCVKDVECKLAATENSMNWYRRQVHEVQANKKTLQIEIDTYRDMLSQKSSTLMNVSSKYKQLNDDYMAIVQKHKREKDSLQAEIDLLKTSQKSMTSVTKYDQQLPSTVPLLVHVGLSNRLELAEEELQKSRSELRSMEHRLQTLGSERAASEATCSKQQIQLSVAEDNLRSYEKERSSLAETCRELRVELGKLRSENASLQIGLLSARQDREQVEQAIEQLRLQLTKIITQYKLLRNKNGELEEKLSSMQNVCEENKRLKLLSYSTNASLFKRLRQERKKTNNLQKQLSQEQSKHRILSEKSKTDASLRDSLKQALERNRELREQLKCSKMSEESVDEGYADGSSTASLSLINLPSPRPLSPTYLNTINDVLVRSKNFWVPIQLGLNELQAKLDNCKIEKIAAVPSTCYMPTPPSSPSGDVQLVA